MPARFKLTAPLPLEQDHQMFLFDWIERIGQHRYPDLKWAYSVPNGASYYGQHRFAEAAKQRSMGLRRGVPDVVVPVRRDQFGGLYLELKRSALEKLSPEQESYRDYLIGAGYAWGRADSGPQAVEIVEAYMRGYL